MRRFLIVGVAVLMLAACTPDDDPTPQPTPVATETPEVTPEPVVTPVPSPEEQDFVVGDKIEVLDQYITVLEVEDGWPGEQYFEPDAGNKFVAILVEIEGISPDASYNPFYFTMSDSEGYEFNFSAFGKEPMLGSDNNLAPGKVVKGWVTFEVPETATDLAVTYAPGIFEGDEAVIYLER